MFTIAISYLFLFSSYLFVYCNIYCFLFIYLYRGDFNEGFILLAFDGFTYLVLSLELLVLELLVFELLVLIVL